VLVRAAGAQSDVEAFVRLEPNSLAIGIHSLTEATFDFENPTPDVYLAAVLYSLVRIFREQRLVRHAEALASVIAERALAHPNEDLAFNACMALVGDLNALVRLAVLNGFHRQVPMHPLIALTVAKAPHDPQSRREAIDYFFNASLIAAREVEPASEAAVHYSIGNFYRSQSERARAAHHYNRARHLRPAYLRTGYFLGELAGVLFVAARYRLAERLYGEAVRLNSDDPDLVFLHGDALLLSGAVAEARSSFEIALAGCTAPRMLLEAELKLMICNELLATAAAGSVPRRRAEADQALRPDGRDAAVHLERLVREVDALHPLVRFNLGVTRSREGDMTAALQHFLICAVVQPQDIVAWANAAICALSPIEVPVLRSVLSTAIHHMGADAYDHFRAEIEAQGMNVESLALLDEMAIQLIEESVSAIDDAFTLRLLDGDGYQAMTIIGTGPA
jgi:tetratricopeptide (TPR) repeat protein